MKRIKYIGVFLLGLLVLSSCNDYLDINVDPNTASNSVASVDSRLAGMQHYFEYAYETAGLRSSLIAGTLTRTYISGNSNSHNQLCAWDPILGSTTTPYQMWFVGCAANVSDIVAKAQQEEAWNYIGAAKLINAMGFMVMVDWYGEIPYTEALGDSKSPKYDSGETVFNGCLAELDEAIKYLEMTQPATATKLAAGDGWNGGDVQKWIKLAYGMKARWLNNLSKKSKLYDPDAILAALDKAAQSNAESSVITHYNLTTDTEVDVLISDPLKTSILYDAIGMNTYFLPTKWYLDLLTNTFTGGSGVEDPRTDKLIPSAQFNINGQLKLVRSKGVDMINSNIRLNNGPILGVYNSTLHKWTVNTTSPDRMGDSVYVNLRSQGAMYYTLVNDDDTYRGTDGRIQSTGTYYTRPDAPGHLMTYPELCFIKAEVLFRKGDKNGALEAYKAGIRTHMELMNVKLSQYSSTDNTSKSLIPTVQIDNFLNSAAVAQSINELTMAKIMQQKYIACSYSLQNWNDMRRFNYSAGNIGDFGVVYPDFDRPKEFSQSAGTKMIGTNKNDVRYWFRRMAQCSIERSFNADNLKASNPEATLDTIWSYPVWWDVEE